MTEKEKKAIEEIKEYIKSYTYLLEFGDKKENYKKEFPRMEAMRIILNLIQKQDTEINKLKQKNEQLKSDLGYTRKIIYTGDHIPRID